MSLSFKHEKVLKFIANLDRQINQVRAFGKKMLTLGDSIHKELTKINDQRKEMAKYLTDGLLIKQFDTLDYLTLEQQQSEGNMLWVKGQLDKWIQVQKKPLSALLESAKKIQSKRLNKTLREDEIAVFKAELTARTAEHKRAVQQMIKTLSHSQVRANCQLLEKLTDRMQQLRVNQKVADSTGMSRPKQARQT